MPKSRLFWAFVAGIVALILSIVGYNRAISMSSTLLLTISLYCAAICIVLLLFGGLYVAFKRWPDLQKTIVICVFIAAMFTIWVIGNWWMQPNSDYFGNAGTGVIGAVIGGFIAKVIDP